MSDGNDEEWLAAAAAGCLASRACACSSQMHCMFCSQHCSVEAYLWNLFKVFFNVEGTVGIFWNSKLQLLQYAAYCVHAVCKENHKLPQYAGYNLHGVLYPTMHLNACFKCDFFLLLWLDCELVFYWVEKRKITIYFFQGNCIYTAHNDHKKWFTLA